jgi:hypothetical protein
MGQMRVLKNEKSNLLNNLLGYDIDMYNHHYLQLHTKQHKPS